MIRKFSDITQDQVALVGGKGLSLAKMAQAGLPVPPGFVVTTEAFDKYVGSDLDNAFIERLYKAFDELGAQRVAVRSSAIAEDSSSASWAGQLETYLNINEFGLAGAIRKCWQSIKSERATQYAARQQADEQSLKVAVVVQAMVDSEVSGVMFTANPITANRHELMIEASFGLGEMIVQGEVTPDNYIVGTNGKITSKTINQKDRLMEWKDGKNIVSSVQKSKQRQAALSDDKVIELAKLGRKVQDYYGSPQDIEWCLNDDSLFIVQARPITTLTSGAEKDGLDISEDRIITIGIGASHGTATGKVRLIKSLAELASVQEGDVLVTHKTTPDYVEAFAKVAAVVTESGGVTSHAAIVSRELGIPAVVGTDDITLKVKTGDIITVDGNTGYVYSGEVKAEVKTLTAEFVIPQPSGDDIEDMINAIATGVNDANELWPLAPVQLMTYIDADQSVDMYQKLKQLEADGLTDDKIAKLFERPIFIKMFLLNTGIIGMKSANIFEQRATKDDQVDFVKRMLKLAKILNQNDDHYVTSRNYLWDKNQVSSFVKQSEWVDADSKTAKAANILSVNLLALNWAMYWDYFPDAGHELHGPYEVPEFGPNSRMVVKDYFNLGSGEVWEYAKDFPFKEVRLAQVYNTDKMYINFGNRLVGQDLSNHTTHFVLLVNGEPVKSLEQIQAMAVELKQLADKQTKHVNSLEPMELVRKGAKITYFTRKKFYQHFNQDWYPKEMVEGTIKAIGTKFIDENPTAKPLSLEEKVKMWDPRNEYLPGGVSMPDWSQTELFRWGPVRAQHFFISDYIAAVYERLPQAYAGESFPLALILFHDPNMVWISDFAEFVSQGKRVFRQYIENPASLAKMHKDWQKAVTQLLGFQAKLNSSDLTKLSDSQLLELWREFYQLMAAFWVPTLLPELGNYGAPELLKQDLSKHVSNPEDLIRAQETLTAPEELSFYQQEELELIKTPNLKIHQSKYFWLKNSYGHVGVLPEEFFAERQKELLSKPLPDAPAKIKQRTATAKHKLQHQFKLPDELMTRAKLIADNVVWQDQRKRYMAENFHYKQMLLGEVGRRRSLPLTDLLKRSFEEVDNLLRASDKPSFDRQQWLGLHADASVTHLSAEQAKQSWEQYAYDKSSDVKIIKGVTASQGGGVVKGRVRVLRTSHEVLEPGEILVATMTSPGYVFAMRQAKAVITDIGGLTSHAAIVSRELGIPCVVGTKIATQVLKTGDVVEVDAARGEVTLLDS